MLYIKVYVSSRNSSKIKKQEMHNKEEQRASL